MRRTQLLWFAVALLLAAPAMADSISPGSNTWNLAPGTTDTFVVEKTVTIDQTDVGNLEVFFLFDTTSSMGDLLTTTVGIAGNIISDLSTVYGASLKVGVGYYQDFGTAPLLDTTYGNPGEVPWAVLQDLTTNTGLATAGLAALDDYLVGGHPSDPESGIYALYQAAMDGSISWGDANTKKMIVWVGDAPSWDAAEFPGVPGGITLANAIAALNSESIIVEALSVGMALGLDGETSAYAWAGGATAGPLQASAIATGTGGSVTDLTGTPLAGITGAALRQAILDAIEIGLTNYETVSLDPSIAEALGLTVEFFQLDADGTLIPADGNGMVYTGEYDRSLTREFRFEVRITAGPDANGTVYQFPIYGTLNGNRIVTEWDNIYVGDRPDGPGDVPEPSTIALMGLGLLGVGFAARRKLRKS